MDEMLDVMKDILFELKLNNVKTDTVIAIQEGIRYAIESIKGTGIYDSLSDVCGKLDDVGEKIEALSGTGLFNSLSDVCDKLDSIETTIDLK